MSIWIDSHTHLDIIDKKPALQQDIVDKSLQNNIQKIITVSTGIKSYFSGKKLAFNNKGIVYTTCGLYPSHADNYNIQLKESLIEQLKEQIVVAVGECGLDYHWNYGTPDLQKDLFRDQINLAKEFDLPLIVHARDSYEDVFALLKEESPLPGGVMHCYCGNEAFAEKFINLGFYISFAGNVTYKKAITLQDSCKMVPLDRLLLETDAPYLTPIPFRGRKNHPEMLIYTAQYISELKKVSEEKLSKATCQNTINLFNLA